MKTVLCLQLCHQGYHKKIKKTLYQKVIIQINKEASLISKGVYNHISDVSLNIPFLLLSHLKMNIKLSMNIHVGTLSTRTKVVARKTSGITNAFCTQKLVKWSYNESVLFILLFITLS